MKKGFALVLVLGIMIAITTLSLSGVFILQQQIRITERKIDAVRAYYAAYTGLVEGYERVRTGMPPIPNNGDLKSNINNRRVRICSRQQGQAGQNWCPASTAYDTCVRAETAFLTGPPPQGCNSP